MRNNLKKVLSCILLGSFAFIFPSTSGFTNHKKVEKSSFSLRANESSTYINIDECKDAPSDLKVNIVSGTRTDSSYSFNFSFSTGGKAFTTFGTPYTIAPDDDNYLEFYNKYVTNYKNLSDEEKEELKNNKREFNAFVNKINGSKANENIIIPNSIEYNEMMILFPTSIGEGALTTYKNVKTITIPSTITSISIETFPHDTSTAGQDFKFLVEVSKEVADTIYAKDWNHGLPVDYNYDYSSLKKDKNKQNDPTAVLAIGGDQTYGNQDANFFLGYNKDGDSYPLIAQYDVYSKANEDGSFASSNLIETRQTKFIQKGSEYDSVGYKLSTFTSSLSLDILLKEKSEVVDPKSLKILNIRSAIEVEGGKWTLDKEISYKVSTPTILFSNVLNFNDFISIHYKQANTFLGYISLLSEYRITNKDLYKQIKPNSYLSNKNKVDNGDFYIRYRITSLPQGNYVVNLKNGETISKRISTPVTQFILSGNHYTGSFLFKADEIKKGLKAEDIASFDIEGLYVTLDLYGSNGPVAKSSISTRFGLVNVIPSSRSAQSFVDYNSIIIIIVITFTLLYACLTTILFFYMKNKFKNDEFRRIKPKKFIKSSIINFIGSLIIVLSITFISMRLTCFKNAVVTFNPTDPFVIVFTIFAVICLGYFIKTAVEMYKANKTRKENKKLQIDKDIVDDGTH